MTRRDDLVEHKGFVLAYLFSAALSLFVVAAALVVAVYAARPAEQRAATGTLSSQTVNSTLHGIIPDTIQLIPQSVRDTLDSQPANLSPSQWREVRETIVAYQKYDQELESGLYAASNRAKIMDFAGDFVFANYESLPRKTKEDWAQLKHLSISSVTAIESDIRQLPQKFVSDTLTTTDIFHVLKAREDYDSKRQYIIQSSSYIDRVWPALTKQGFKVEPLNYGSTPTDPLADFPAFATSQYAHCPFPPPLLPPTTLTVERVTTQASEPPLSTGSTSQERMDAK